LKMRQVRREVEPRIRQSRFSLKLSSTVWRDFPPYLTMVSWMMMVDTKMIRNNLLLKKFSKTLEVPAGREHEVGSSLDELVELPFLVLVDSGHFLAF